MIGLGSNRLSVCRRGGMSVTQAGRGGMEWLAGGRGPSWSSPYSAQATAALKDAYPDLWTTLRDFGFRNPDKVSFINQYPLVAPYLLADGLAFMVDCQYECSAALWKDLIGSKEFVGTGMTLADGVPSFSGSGYYSHSQSLNFPRVSSTIEVAYILDNNEGIMFIDATANGSLASVYAGKYLCSESTSLPMYTKQVPAGSFATMSYKNQVLYENKVLLTNPTGSDTWNATGVACIGRRSNGSSPFKGKIYAIRIYNRLLTEQEILANQAIDLQRWQAS